MYQEPSTPSLSGGWCNRATESGVVNIPRAVCWVVLKRTRTKAAAGLSVASFGQRARRSLSFTYKLKSVSHHVACGTGWCYEYCCGYSGVSSRLGRQCEQGSNDTSSCFVVARGTFSFSTIKQRGVGPMPPTPWMLRDKFDGSRRVCLV